ncbi:hypothetical protein QH494_12625 [Sphingomonas sp. AR_OL41]|jgi:uncharacterized membrane protein YfcA|uniref:hypothetical protein n=1 Tax=Sphingomonas sp. AR_OL41 TaxID=3042729 RepID=UPI0024804BFB|nr:hypothetical protein [Sphingomonas sp. AR_OL41]MDH7973024.1 hypothetical protein [Sphingomonas sp. AR_OL41]
MYSESDIDGAVAAGAITREAATALRDHIALSQSAPAVDEEHFRLLTGFNDIFVSIAAAAVLVGMAWLGQSITLPLAGALVAATSWGLAEYFTRTRRMALPSILLLLAFVGGVGAAQVGLIVINGDALEAWAKLHFGNHPEPVIGTLAAIIGAVTAFAAWLHWRRFMVPITVAAGAVAVVGVMLAMVVGYIPHAQDFIYAPILVAGVVMFGLAMMWDASDRERRTRRADVAFWLHLAAAPMIAHALFQLLGVFDAPIGVGMAVMVIALYIAFAFVALAVDRRALLVSSLAYVLYAMYSLFQGAGAVELAWAFTALVIGSALLLLSAFWQTTRAHIVGLLGGLANRLPPVGTIVHT